MPAPANPKPYSFRQPVGEARPQDHSVAPRPPARAGGFSAEVAALRETLEARVRGLD